MSEEKVETDNIFIAGDPITILFRKRLRMRPLLATVVIVLLLNIPIIIASLINHAWLTKPGQIGLASDYGWWILNLTSVPATIFYFFWLPDTIQDVLDGLVTNKVILRMQDKDEVVNYGQFLSKFQKDYTHPALILVCTIPVAIYMIFLSIPVQMTYRSWQTSGNFVFWYTVFFWVIGFLLGSLMLFRGILSIIWFNKLFKEFRINVRVLHPDGAGGLSPLGLFSVRIAYLLGIYGLAAVAAAMNSSYLLTTEFTGPALNATLTPLVITYIVLAPIVFFTPIGAARNAMRAAKTAMILKISDQFDADRDQLLLALGSNAKQLNQGIKKIEGIQKIHKLTMGFPVWPFNIENLARFFTAISSPVILGLLSFFIDILR